MLYQFFNETTIHGLGYVTKGGSKHLNFLWIAIFLGFASISTYNICLQIHDYLELPTATQYSIKSAANLSFPKLGVCGLSKVDGRKAQAMHISNNLLETISLAFNQANAIHYAPVNFSKVAMRAASSLDEYASLLLRTGLDDFRDFIQHLSFSCEDLVESCLEFGSKTTFNCCKDSKPYFLPNGLCFLLHLPAQHSPNVGVQILLKILSDEQMVPANIGAFVENASMVWLYSSETDLMGISQYIPQGVHHTLTLKRNVFHSVSNPPKFYCKDDPAYSESKCYRECTSRPMIKACNCSMIDLGLGKRKTCTPCGLLECNQKPEMLNVTSKSLLAQCEPECPLACQQGRYSITPTHAPFSRVLLTHQWKNDTRVEELMNHRAVLELVYDKMDYTEVRKFFSMTPRTLLSNFGGVLGLFLGASFISLIHAVVFFLKSCCLKLKPFFGVRERKKKIDQDRNLEVYGTPVVVVMPNYSPVLLF